MKNLFSSMVGKRASEEKSEAAPLYDAGMKLLADGKTDEAEVEWHKAIAIDGGFAKAYVALGNAALMKSEPQSAIPHYKAAIERGGKTAEVYSNLGVALRMLGRPEEAVPAHQAAVDLAPEDPITVNNFAALYMQLGRQDDAQALLQKMLDKTPDEPLSNIHIARVLTSKAEYEKALEHLERASSNGRYATEASLERGRVLCLSGRIPESFSEIRSAVTINRSAIAAIQDDPEFAPVHALPEYKQFLLELPKMMFAMMLRGKPPLANPELEPGVEYSLVALAVAHSIGEARQMTAERVGGLGWTELFLQGANPVDPATVPNMGPDERQAIQAAQQNGFHLLVFRQ